MQNALQFPACIHLCCTLLHTQDGVKEKFVRDVRETSALVRADPDKFLSSGVAMYGSSQSMPDRGLVNELTW